MSDIGLDITIRTLADTHGAEEVQKALNGVKAEVKADTAATGDARESSKRFTDEAESGIKRLLPGKRELHQAMRLLGSQFGELRGLAGALFNPWSVAIGGVLFLTRSVTESNERLKAALDALKAPIGDIAGATRGVRMEAIGADEAFNTLAASIGRNARAALQDIENLKKATAEVMKAKQDIALSKAKTPKERQQIEERYDIYNTGMTAEYAKREIKAREAHISALQSAMGAAAEKTHGLTQEQVQAKLRDLPKAIQDITKQIEELKTVAEGQKPTWIDWFASSVPGYNREAYSAKWSAQQSTLGSITSLGALKQDLLGREKGLHEADAGFEEQKALRKSIEDSKAELQGRRSAIGTEAAAGHTVRRMRALGSDVSEFGDGTGVASILGQAGENMSTARHGGRLTRGQENVNQRAIQFLRNLEYQDSQLNAILDMLASRGTQRDRAIQAALIRLGNVENILKANPPGL